MCGIFGATNLSTYEKLYKENRQRGNFAGGSLYATPSGDMYVKKWEGIEPLDILTGSYAWCDQYKLFMGHTQAPTSAAREYNVSTTHPFEHGWYIVAHNGVLENHNELKEEHLHSAEGTCDLARFDIRNNPVDSSVIPALLDEMYVGSDVKTISESFSMLKGTFACWIYSKRTRQAYIVRSGSTLFGNYDTSTFSSIRVPGLAEEEIPEGVIFCVTEEGLTNVGNFSKNSPFFII